MSQKALPPATQDYEIPCVEECYTREVLREEHRAKNWGMFFSEGSKNCSSCGNNMAKHETVADRKERKDKEEARIAKEESNVRRSKPKKSNAVCSLKKSTSLYLHLSQRRSCALCIKQNTLVPSLKSESPCGTSAFMSRDCVEGFDGRQQSVFKLCLCFLKRVSLKRYVWLRFARSSASRPSEPRGLSERMINLRPPT